MFEGVQDYEKFGNHCPRPILICILPQQIHRLHNLNRTPHCPSHRDKRNSYVRMLFIDYSSAFNTIVPTKLITKLRTLGTKHLPLQLDPGLPDSPPPGGKSRQQHICHADP